MKRALLTLAFLGLLFVFLVSIGLVGDSFKLFGKDLARRVFEFTSNPFVGLFVGVLSTSLVQSSSTTTSIVVGLVGSGEMSVVNAVPIIMGANIGTSVTNTLVSFGHISRGSEFRRAFAAATVHDFFNVLSVLILFPLQWQFNILGSSAEWIAGLLTGGANLKFHSPLKVVIEPVVHGIASAVAFVTNWPALQAIFLLLIAAAFLFLSLKYMTVIMRGAVVEKASGFFEKTIFRTPYLAFLVGMVITAIVQSSSVTTSMVVPLAGAGVLTLVQIYPYTLGANVGTTITAMLASLAAPENFQAAVAVALSHLLFNIFGICAVTTFRPIRVLPMRLAEKLAEMGSRRRWVPVVYVLVAFFLVPLLLIFLF